MGPDDPGALVEPHEPHRPPNPVKVHSKGITRGRALIKECDPPLLPGNQERDPTLENPPLPCCEGKGRSPTPGVCVSPVRAVPFVLLTRESSIRHVCPKVLRHIQQDGVENLWDYELCGYESRARRAFNHRAIFARWMGGYKSLGYQSFLSIHRPNPEPGDLRLTSAD